jgi:hypothetical protein
MQKPNGLVILENKDLPHGLFHLKLQDITGIGHSMLARLNRGGIHSLEQLYAAPRDVLHTVWGGMMGDEIDKPPTATIQAAAPAHGLAHVSSAAHVQNAKPTRDPARLLAAMDSINKTQGKNALYFATAHNSLNNAPMRIAFNRIPDIETER